MENKATLTLAFLSIIYDTIKSAKKAGVEITPDNIGDYVAEQEARIEAKNKQLDVE